MPKYKRILCPVDLSDNSLEAIEMATTLAKAHDSKIMFCYVTPLWEPSGSSQLQEYAKQIVEESQIKLYKIRPTDPSVGFEHQLIYGNAGPELVNETKNADMIVMSTHGRSGIFRLIMGSVANYVLRNAKCSVVLVKGTGVLDDALIRSDENAPNQAEKDSQKYVTEIMHQVPAVRSFETMDSVLNGLKKARETAAPVVDGSGTCIGILTTTDIEDFHAIQKRFEEKDESVLEEVFEVDQYGQRKVTDYNFDQVQRHMTKEVISLQVTDSVRKAIELFDANPTIHHLVVLDADDHPVGVVDAINAAEISELENVES
jgi:nucleotide-binding universal stress UspA family protein